MKLLNYIFIIFSFITLASCRLSYDKNLPKGEVGLGGWGGGGDFGGGDGNGGNGIYLNAKVCLEGAVENPSTLEMRTTLNEEFHLPYVSPYSASPWFHTSLQDIALTSLSYTPSILDGDGIPLPPAPVWVDWVLVELYTYDVILGYVKAGAQSALVLWDGFLYDTTAEQGLHFPELQPGTYYINIKHRNHLAIAADKGISLAKIFRVDVPDVDFTDGTAFPTTGYVANVGSNQCMAAGDINGDLSINSDDLALINAEVDSFVHNAANGTRIFGYFFGDLNLDRELEKLDDEDSLDHTFLLDVLNYDSNGVGTVIYADGIGQIHAP
jgi:hypothetical protein